MFYRPEGNAVCADVIPFFENGEFKLFYLKDYRDVDGHGEGCDWNLLSTKDLVHYKDFGTVLKRGGTDEQDLYMYTGCCIKAGDEYLIFYTGHNPHKRADNLPEEKVLLAKSYDLLHWKKERNFSMQAPKKFEMHDFRDPFVFFDEENNRYAMLIAARNKNDDPLNFKGVTLIAYSSDLQNWKIDEKPFYEPRSYFAHECPDLFKINDWWYLVFSEFTDKYITTYRMSKSLKGPWITPKVNSFDGHAFYAAKSVSDGNRRILWGWNPIKDGEKDCNLWQWGGNIIPHEIVQLADGTLRVKCPRELEDFYDKKVELTLSHKMGKVWVKDNHFKIGDNYGRSLALFGKLPKKCKISFDFNVCGEAGDFGIILNADFNSGNTYYTLKFEPLFNRFSLDRWPRRDLANHTATDTERYFKAACGENHTAFILIENSVIEVYVDGQVAMGGRMFDFRGDWGLYSMCTEVEFKNVCLQIEDVNEKV